MSHVPIGRRAITAVLSSMLLMAAMCIPLVGIAVADTPPNNCQTFEGESETSFSTCYLDIAAPSSVRTGVAFTVQVRVTTNESREVVANTDPCGSKAAITLRLFNDTGEGEVFVSDQTANASAGIATFSLTIDDSGEYELVAEGPGGGDVSATATADCDNTSYIFDEAPLMAVDIPADAPIAPCPPDTSCVQATSNSGTQATLIASEGSAWTPKPQPGTNPDFPYFSPVNATDQCGSSSPTDPNGVLGYSLTTTDGTTTGVIILAIDPRGQGVGLFNVCWTQSIAFTPLGGGPPVTTGDLPNCKQRDQIAPCVIARTGGSGGEVVFLTILATALPDPFGYGH